MKKLFKILLFFTAVFLSVPAVAGATEVQINLRAWTTDGLMTNQTLTVQDCEDSPDSGNFTVNGLCAIEQSGFPAVWQWWGTDAFLDSWNGYLSNDNNNGVYWAWFGDRELGATALNTHILSPDEELFLTYGPNPLRLTIDDETPDVGQAITITVEEFDYDINWNAVWSPSEEALVSVSDGSTGSTDASGIYYFTPSNGDPVSISAVKNTFADSNEITVDPNDPPPPTLPSSGGGGGVVLIPSPPPPKIFDLNGAINFILNQQKPNGSFGDTLYTDWVAVALGAAENSEYVEAKDRLRAYLKENPLATGGLLTDYERRSMALMALNMNPYTDGGFDYIAEIVKSFDGNQFGDPDLFNDDIFAILVLTNAGYDANDPMLQSTVRWLLAKQSIQGDFSGVDLTAAFIQALEPLNSISDIKISLDRAKNYLRSRQESSGGLGSVFGTSWAAQTSAISRESALRYLALFQLPDGGLQDIGFTPDSRLWATAYAVPAVSGKDWNAILSDFVKPAPVVVPEDMKDTEEPLPPTPLSTFSKVERGEEGGEGVPESIVEENVLVVSPNLAAAGTVDAKDISSLFFYSVLSIGGLLILRRALVKL